MGQRAGRNFCYASRTHGMQLDARGKVLASTGPLPERRRKAEEKSFERDTGMKMQFTAMRRIHTAPFLIVLLAFALIAPASLRAQFGAAPAPRLTAPIDETRLVPLKGSVLPAIRSQQSSEAAPDGFKLDRMMLQLKRSDAQQANLKQWLDDQQNPKSPRFHQWLSPQEYGSRFGAAPEDIATITEWLQSHGFTVDAVSNARNILTFSGTQASLRNAFHTEMRGYTIRNEHHWANASEVKIPAALAPVVGGIVSLNDVRRHANHRDPVLLKKNELGSKWTQVGQWSPQVVAASGNRPAPQFTAYSGNTQVYLLAPYDFATVYNLQPLWNAGLDGTGQTIAITARSNVNPADIAAFRAEYGLPATKLNVIFPTGVDPQTGATTGDYNDESETDLDVEWSGAVAKGATIDLVATPSTSTTDGTDISDEYIVDEDLASVMSVSYGTCEFDLQQSGNLFFYEIWQQAAAEGITVTVATGDYGPATCDEDFAAEGDTVAIAGDTVNGIASTPYNVAVGGTDFKTYNTVPGEFWSPTNDPTTLASVQAYVPESPWDDSCQNPELLAWLNANGGGYANTAAVCGLGPTIYQNFEGGGGGASNCINATSPYEQTECTQGYPKPSWQSAIPGVPSDNARDIPDVSLFAANGNFNSLLPYCQSDALATGSTCATSIEGAGGTSFASPAFAGIMAIVNQQMQGPQGVANYSLYKLGTKQFNDSSLASCTTSTVASGNACYFYDLAEGSDAVPCSGGSSGSTGCVNQVLGWNAGVGYDLASGIGSVNAYNLVTAWPSAASNLLTSATSLTVAPTTIYGTSLTASISVAPASAGSSTPSGPVVIQVDGQVYSLGAELSNGSTTVSIPAIPVGTHQVTAAYGGDAVFAESDSAVSTLVVSKATPAVALAATRGSVAQGQNITLSAALQVVTDGNPPGGSVTFTDNTTYKVLGTSPVVTATDPVTGQSASAATLIVGSDVLGSGANVIAASYSGDISYNPIISNTVTATYAQPFTASITPGSLQMSAAAVASGSVTINLTPAAGSTLQASAFGFNCGGSLPPGVSCSFSPATLGSSGAVTSTLTVQVNTAQIPTGAPEDRHSGRLDMIALSGLAGFLLTFALGKRSRNQLRLLAALVVGVTASCVVLGCGHSGAPAPITSGPGSTVTTLAASSQAPAYGSAVTLSAKITPGASGGTPTGSVTFLDGGTALGTVTLANSTASFTDNSLALGVHSITAKYSGDTGDQPSVSAADSVDVTYSTNLTINVTGSDGSTSVSLPVAVQ